MAGYFFKDAVEALFKTPLIEAAIRFFTASLLLALAEYFDKKMRRLESMTWLDALIVGLFQIIAVFPGASRSGTTISGSMFRGFAREDAARFAFLMSIPVMLAAGSYEMLSVIERSGTRAFLPYLITGFITAAIVGWLAIKWLMNYLHNNKHSLIISFFICSFSWWENSFAFESPDFFSETEAFMISSLISTGIMKLYLARNDWDDMFSVIRSKMVHL